MGRRLQNEKLAKALEKTTEFSGREWEAFGLTDLQKNDVIKVGNGYFTPVAGDEWRRNPLRFQQVLLLPGTV